MAVRLSIIGSSPAWPNTDGAHSGYRVEGRLLLDCGPGVLAKLRDHEAWPSVEAIFITHLHLDHWGDLVPWVWSILYGPGRNTRPELWLPPGSREALRPLLARLGTEDMLERAFDVSEYEPRRPVAVTGLEVTAIPVIHYDLDAYAFRVEGTSSLGYSGDSGPCDALAEIADGADLFLCEATLERGELEGDDRGHLDIDEALAAGAGAKRIVLTHRPQELAVPAGLEMAYDGLELTI
jgi:ribonuclease BN (tRNA processing enzyme)